MAKTSKQESSAEIVSSVEDLLLLILISLPIRSLIRFKSVCKHWLSLISSPEFAILHRHDPKPPALGLFLRNKFYKRNPEFEFVNFKVYNPIRPPFSMLQSRRCSSSADAVNILQSCNGLFLCSSTQVRRPWREYHLILNPTTKQSTAVPRPGKKDTINGICLAFDPVKSPEYKLVCILNSDSVPGSYQIKIYSSKTRSWNFSGNPFIADHDFKNGVFWNGAINWLSHWSYEKSMYFNVDEERLEEMPSRDPSERHGLKYFGESNGHLHLTEICMPMPDYDIEINEMKRDYSGWFVKYRVRLSELSRAFPKMVQDKYYKLCELSVLAVIRGEEERDAFVVLQIPGKAIRYNLANHTFFKLCDFVDGASEEDIGWLRFHDFCANQFSESLVCV